MPYRGWFTYGGQEIANSSRTFALLGSTTPTSDIAFINIVETPYGSGLFVITPPLVEGPPGLFAFNPPYFTQGPTGLFAIPSPSERNCPQCQGLKLGYRDDWPGLPSFAGGADYAHPHNSPWHDPSFPASGEFKGVMITAVDGLDTVPISRSVFESICDGGVAGGHRDTTRTLRFTAMLYACTNAGVDYGLSWLTCRLRESICTRGLPLTYLKASPQSSQAAAAALKRTVYDVVMTQAPTITGRGRGYGGRQNEHGAVYQVQWEMVAARPYAWSDPVTTLASFGVTETLSILWSATCTPGSVCAVPSTVLVDPLCTPASLPVSPTPPDLGCGTGAACTSLCSGSQQVYTYPPSSTSIGSCTQRYVDIEVTNNAVTEVRGIVLKWVVQGQDRECSAFAQAEIGYIPAGGKLILDGVRNIVRAVIGGVDMTAPGIVFGPGKRPWSAESLDAMTTYELVLVAPPGSNLTINVLSRIRDS